MRYLSTAVIMVALSLVAFGCDDNNNGTGCIRDSDCRGERVCVSGACEAPDDSNGQGAGSNSNTSSNAVQDTGDSSGERDTGGTTEEDTAVVQQDTLPEDEPSVDPPDTDIAEPDTFEPPDMGEPPISVCAEALGYLEGCGNLLFFEGQYDLRWPACDTERDNCAAECLLRQNCEALGCDFNPNVDCDAPGPVWDCLQNECAEPDNTCETCDATYDCCGGPDGLGAWVCHASGNSPTTCDRDCAPTSPEQVCACNDSGVCEPTDVPCACGTTYDCCAGAWLCFDADNPPFTCALACNVPTPAPDCGCNDAELCEWLDPEPDDSVCDQAVEHLTDACGISLDFLRENHPRDHALVAQLADGDCTDPYLRCYADCMAFPTEDACFSCRFIEQTCLRDPFSECIVECERPITPDDVIALCIDTGGSWDNSDCANCCGPTTCGQDPEEPCGDDCCGDSQCVCPNNTPFWSIETGCFNADACYP